MSARTGRTLLLGSLIFLVITFFEQIPVIGWLGAVASLIAWIWLAGVVRRGGGAFVDAAVVGVVTGLVGAVSGTIFLVLWPIVGACVCAAAASLRSRR